LETKPLKEIVSRWLLAIGSFAILLFFFSPPWWAFRMWVRVPEIGVVPEVRRGVNVLYQVEHLGAAIPDQLHGVIQWRLLFPVVGHVFSLPPMMLFGLADLGCVFVLAFIITVLRRRGLGFVETGLIAVTLGATSWFFTSTGWLGYFDSWLALALLLVAFARASWPVWLACLWAPWVDERFAVAVLLALFCRYLLRINEAGTAVPVFRWMQEFIVPVGLVAAFVVVRLGLLPSHSGSMATVGGYLATQNNLAAPWPRIALGIWEGLRAAWFLVVAAVWLGWRRRWESLTMGAVLVAIAGLGIFSAQDFSRSMTMVLPVAMYGAILTVKMVPGWWPWALRVGAAAALVLPAHHVISDRVNPIYYLYHEIANVQRQPRAIMPELFELGGIHEMEEGDSANAESDLSMAIKLSDDPTGPAKQRGLLYANQGRWADARRDFTTMVEHEPKNPDAWFMRAQAALALGDVVAAQADMQQAVAVAPKDWTTRPAVAQFLTRLNQRPGGK
jgi:hypothetical protein